MLKIYGDSITAGVPGAAYCNFLKGVIPFKKFGVGGDTVYGLLHRMKDAAISEKDRVIIEIGTNDIMLPYLRTLSDEWDKKVSNIELSGRTVSKSIDDFRNTFDELLLLTAKNKAAVISIPCIGEDIGSPLNKRVDEYNDVIQELCRKHDVTYIDFNTQQKNEIARSASGIHSYFIREKPIGMIVDVLLTACLNLTDYLSKQRNLLTTVDGVHLNTAGAKLLAAMMTDAVTKHV